MQKGIGAHNYLLGKRHAHLMRERPKEQAWAEASRRKGRPMSRRPRVGKAKGAGLTRQCREGNRPGPALCLAAGLPLLGLVAWAAGSLSWPVLGPCGGPTLGHPGSKIKPK